CRRRAGETPSPGCNSKSTDPPSPWAFSFPAAKTDGNGFPPGGRPPMAADPWFQTLFADRVGGANYGKGTEIYKFEKIKRAKRKALADHPDRKLLDFGIGENDDMAAPV